MSKGSKQRPTDKQKFNDAYDRIFNKQKKQEEKVPQEQVGSVPSEPRFVTGQSRH